MKKKFQPLSLDDVGILLVIAATLFGGWMRLLPPLLAGFPINDGGLFYEFINAIQANGYHLPTIVNYNGLAIPFTYPPFALYAGAILGELLHASTIEIVRWLPAIITILTIPAFFGLARTILRSGFEAGVATLFFALTPRSIIWFIMGGGITRSFGELFLILAAQRLYRLFTEQDQKHLYFSGFLCALIVLTHPEATLHTIGMGILFWVMRERNKKGFVKMIGVGIIVILATLVWWGPVMAIHGLRPFLSAAQTGLYGLASPANIFLLIFLNEPFMTFVAVFAVVGLALVIARKEFFFPIWILMQFVLEPRNAPNVAILPITMLSAIAFCEVILPGIQKAAVLPPGSTVSVKTENQIRYGFLLFLGLYLLGGMAYSDIRLVKFTMTDANRQAFEWVSANTPTDSRFLLLTGQSDLFSDGTAEWFPALTRRISVATIQGREWTDGADFSELIQQFQALQTCAYFTDPLACIDQTKNKLALKFDYIYISRFPRIMDFPTDGENLPKGDTLIVQLEQRPAEYEKVFQSEDVAIFKIKP